ncbi:MAG: ParB N-terminal domain-containing protein [Alphaproteobacteria bacterium]|nr:ParB N-terminal domain-containing protein [Alphaproteobacteria bacterium]
MIKLVPIEAVRPSTYNPRKADPVRLKIIELSLRKLGWLLPIYADEDGEILSGHQRHYVAMRMGIKKVPVSYVPRMTLEERKAINIAFNRGTNDMQNSDAPDTLKLALEECNVFDIAADMPDQKKTCPCLETEAVSIAPFLEANKGRWVPYTRNLAQMLRKRGIQMPVVATKDYKIVNGLGRVELAAERGEKEVPVVWITDAQAELASAMLNFLSMDFDIHTRYADLLRYNSFRRVRRVRETLGWGFVFAHYRKSVVKEYDVTAPENAKHWKNLYGTSVVDFGAGHLTETKILRSIGVRVSPFEPYRIGEKDIIDKAESLALTSAFLADIAAGTRYDSVFISSVLNSVPFKEDREHIACLCAALCGSKTRLYAVASARSHANWKNLAGCNQISERRLKECLFRLDYEGGISLGDFQSKPKVQKYHSQKEFYELFQPFFERVQVGERVHNVTAICAGPKPINPTQLKAAIAFEFDLPYPDGSRMGLVEEATSAYEKRLGIKL